MGSNALTDARTDARSKKAALDIQEHHALFTHHTHPRTRNTHASMHIMHSRTHHALTHARGIARFSQAYRLLSETVLLWHARRRRTAFKVLALAPTRGLARFSQARVFSSKKILLWHTRRQRTAFKVHTLAPTHASTHPRTHASRTHTRQHAPTHTSTHASTHAHYAPLFYRLGSHERHSVCSLSLRKHLRLDKVSTHASTHTPARTSFLQARVT